MIVQVWTGTHARESLLRLKGGFMQVFVGNIDFCETRPYKIDNRLAINHLSQTLKYSILEPFTNSRLDN